MLIRTVFVVFLLFHVLSGTSSAKTSLFKEAGIAEKSGDFDNALFLYEEVLKQDHGSVKPHLRAYDHILKIHDMRKEAEKRNALLAVLKGKYPDESFDLLDVEKLSVMYLKYGTAGEALELQRTIVDTPCTPVNRKAILRTYSRLLKYHAERNEGAVLPDLLNGLTGLASCDPDEKDVYESAMLHLKYGDRSKAADTLRYLTQAYPDATSARQALFVLAKEAEGIKDYSSAIRYYTAYIKNYPEHTFFVQKACQRIVDCTLAQGKGTLSGEFAQQVANWVNGVSDYRSQLDLARNLKEKNMDLLAEGVFATGHGAALQFILGNPETYEALKAHLEIARAAYLFLRYELVEESALAMLNDFKKIEGGSNSEDVRFVQSQAYLWLAKIYKEQKRYSDAITRLQSFLDLYPKHKDRDYAHYELGLIYEKTGNTKKSREFYSKVASEPLKTQAEQRLADHR